MEPRVWVEEIMFSDGTKVSLRKDDIVVIVGPNNSGKSAALRGIREKVNRARLISPVIQEITIGRDGSADELIAWLDKTHKGPEGTYRTLGGGVNHVVARARWQRVADDFEELAPFFCRLLSADERLKAGNPPPSISPTHDAPGHPGHMLLRDEAMEKLIALRFSQAFGEDLTVYRGPGQVVPLYVGIRPIPAPGQDRASPSYLQELEKLPQLQVQGDGMRSFAGVLLHKYTGKQTVLLVDEPEAFLHPPQARQLGAILAEGQPSDCQLFIATHSGDVLRGLLDLDSPRVRVIRLHRSGAVNIARQLDNEKVEKLWRDSLLRYSNILDGLFHEIVVVCESDADCRFYSAMLKAVLEAEGEGSRIPDIMFAHCGGKDRMPLVIRSLQELDVPVRAIADFDVLAAESPLRGMVESAGANWDQLEKDWKTVKNAVDNMKPELNTDEIRTEIEKILRGVSAVIFPEEAKREIQKVLRRSSPWSVAKTVGVSQLPSGQPTQACTRLLAALQKMGIFIVRIGELEQFAKSVGGHGPTWVNGVLQKDLRTDVELESAREFISRIVRS